MTKAEAINTSFNWQIIETPNTGHEFEPTIEQAADLLVDLE